MSANPKLGRILITGMGVATPVGITVRDFWQAALDGRSGLRLNPHVDMRGLPCGFVVGAMPEELKHELRSSPGAQGRSWLEIPGPHAFEQALADAGHPERSSARWAAVTAEVSVPFWGDEVELESWRRSVSACRQTGWELSQVYAHYDREGPHPQTAPASHLHLDIQQALARPIVAMGLDATCTSGVRTLAEAVRLVRLGRADIALAVASSTRLTSFLAGTYAQMLALSCWKEPPEQACKPFDQRRDGMVPGEGAAALVIESEEHATRRGAPHAYASILGSGFATGGAHPTQPDADCVAVAIERGLANAGLDTRAIDAVNAHGTSTRLNDLNEAMALHKVFGPRVPELGLSACKSIIGHTSHASGLVETVIAALTLEHGLVPGIPTCLEPDPECNLPVSRTTVARPMRVLLKTAFGFGGQYGALLLGRAD
jgi:3-oxoacyl-[acyl-carrier-protein] synthase II